MEHDRRPNTFQGLSLMLFYCEATACWRSVMSQPFVGIKNSNFSLPVVNFIKDFPFDIRFRYRYIYRKSELKGNIRIR